jgi:hypothetical protein
LLLLLLDARATASTHQRVRGQGIKKGTAGHILQFKKITMASPPQSYFRLRFAPSFANLSPTD